MRVYTVVPAAHRYHTPATTHIIIILNMKSPGDVRRQAESKPSPTKGVKIARENRNQCNSLTPEERAALTNRALQLINGGNGLAKVCR